MLDDCLHAFPEADSWREWSLPFFSQLPYVAGDRVVFYVVGRTLASNQNGHWVFFKETFSQDCHTSSILDGSLSFAPLRISRPTGYLEDASVNTFFGTRESYLLVFIYSAGTISYRPNSQPLGPEGFLPRD